MKNKNLVITLVILIVLTVILATVQYWSDIKQFFGNKLSPFDYVKTKGATDFTTQSGQTGRKYGGYQFYPNDRVLQVSSGKMGTYDKQLIKWDDKTETKLSVIFK